jgi:hypothetical protein
MCSTLKFITLTVLLLSAGLLPGMSWASDVFQSELEIIEECSYAGSSADVGRCYARKAKESEIALKEAEKKLRAALDKWFIEEQQYIRLAKTRLTASGKDFIRYRESQCAFAWSLGGSAIGHALEMGRDSCIAGENNHRAALLTSYSADVPSQEDVEKAEEQDCLKVQEKGWQDLMPGCASVLERMRKREAASTNQQQGAD